MVRHAPACLFARNTDEGNGERSLCGGLHTVCSTADSATIPEPPMEGSDGCCRPLANDAALVESRAALSQLDGGYAKFISTITKVFRILKFSHDTLFDY